MTREISLDYETLATFITQFSIRDIVKNVEFQTMMKPMHKKLFALMTFVAEVDHKNEELHIISSDGLSYLKESASDMGQSLFCWIQGAYKPANLMLRSSIETYVRAIAGQENDEIYREKNVYKVFETAQATSYFSSELCKDHSDMIYVMYRNLCKVVHTADFTVMSHISALKTFPLFSPETAKDICRDFIKISTAMLSIFYINYFIFIHRMHPHNQNNLLGAIPKATKRKINEAIG